MTAPVATPTKAQPKPKAAPSAVPFWVRLNQAGKTPSARTVRRASTRKSRVRR